MENNRKNTNSSTRNQFFFLTFTHTILDSYANLFPHLQPRLLANLASATTRNSFAGILISVYSLFSSLGQVFFGWLSDRVRTVHFITFGVAFTVIGLGLVSLIPSTTIVIVLLAIGGTGIAAFHPQATTYAGALAAETRGMGISIFLTGGNIGRAIGPVVLLLIPYRLGYGHLIWEMIPGLLVALSVPIILKFEHELDLTASTRVLSHGGKTQRESFWIVVQPHLFPLIVLFVIASFRTVTGIGLENFLSIYFNDLNYSDQMRSLVVALYIFAGSMGIMGSGWVLSRVHTLILLLFSLVVAPPLLYIALHTQGITALVFLFLGNVVLSSSITLNIIVAQIILRGHENIASSFMMGASWGVGGLLNLVVGALADKYGLPIVLDWLVMVPLMVSPLVIFLRSQPDLSKPKSEN
ncbi:MAG: MFS transporter [Candidatus Poribacteria bacterium]|nr:MFS transporter [Candidatus Poribacteria bacterium]